MNIPTPQSILATLDSNYDRITQGITGSNILWKFKNRIIGIHNDRHVLITHKYFTDRWKSYNLNTNSLNLRIL